MREITLKQYFDLIKESKILKQKYSLSNWEYSLEEIKEDTARIKELIDIIENSKIIPSHDKE